MNGDTDKRKNEEELKQALAEERSVSKKTIRKLQRELDRERSNRVPSTREDREHLLKEIDRERMMRLGTEQRLQDVQLESDSCRTRLHALQEEFRKMEEMVANMLQYKVKVDQLKQENASMKSSYETNLQKYCTHISTLERDNMMLRNQVKKMEAQLHGKGDERDKTKLLLERLKMVEAENSSLVLENEQQRQQYEKCLDEIANQVVQALLAQKMLREECLKLQTRVQDLELQNKHLNIMFQQRLKLTSESVLQVQHSTGFPSNQTGHISVSANTISPAVVTMSQEDMITLDYLANAGSLLSMCSEIMGDDSPGKPQMSSPPPWLRDKLLATSSAAGDTSPSSTTSSASTASPPTPDATIVQTKIETEFPATNTSPRMNRISVYQRRARSLERGLSSFSFTRRSGRGGNRSRRGSDSHDTSYSPVQRLKQSSSADAISHFEIHNRLSASQSQLLAEAVHWNKSSQDRVTPQILIQSLPKDTSPAVLIAGADFNHKSFEAFNKSFEKLLAKTSFEDTRSPVPQPTPEATKSVLTPRGSSSQEQPSVHSSSPQSLASHRIATQNRSSQSPVLRNPYKHSLKSSRSSGNVPGQYYYYDYSDEDSDSRPVSRDFSTASTMSLNELLDSSAEAELALDEEFFSDWSSVCITPNNKLDNLSGVKASGSPIESKHKGNSSSFLSKSCSTSSSPDTSGIQKSHHVSSLTEMRLRQGKITSTVEASQDLSENSSDTKTLTKPTSNNPVSLDVSNNENDFDKSSAVSRNISQKSQSGDLESTSSEKTKCPEVAPELHSEDTKYYFLASQSPSPNLSQMSQDLGYASKGSHSQSSPSPSPSMTHKGTSLWLKSTKDPPSGSRGDLLTMAVARDTIGISSRHSSNGSSSGQTLTMARPGQLILAPQDNNFSFHGFSSASSTSSEDKSPLKIFESKQNSDMKSSVIEVKKDGTFVHTMQSLGDSNCETSSSLSASPSSPVKIPSKIPPPVAKKPTRVVKPEARPVPDKARDDLTKNVTKQLPVSGTTDITVGFLLNDQIFPGKKQQEAVEDLIKNKNLPGQCKDPGNIFPTKCQSSDSSFENLRVERSGSKDDGYSTMSSDILPEVLEKFSDTLTQKLSDTSCSKVTSTASVILISQTDKRKYSDPTIHGRDRSFDLTSDPDSALEASSHSTAEMVNSSSSQVSTSSSDYPLSPCSKVSKIARLFDGGAIKLNLQQESVGSGSSRLNDNSISSSSKASSNSSTPESASTFVPSSCQPPESPRRLTLEFQKTLTVKPTGSPVVFRKISPGSPKNVSKSCGGFLNLTQKSQLTSRKSSGIPEISSSRGIPEISVAKNVSELRTSNLPNPQLNKASLTSSSRSLPKGFYNSKDKSVSKPVIPPSGDTESCLQSTKTDCTQESVSDKLKINQSVKSSISNKDNVSSSLLSQQDMHITNASLKDLGNYPTNSNLEAHKNSKCLYKYHPRTITKSTSNNSVSVLNECKNGLSTQEQTLQSNIMQKKYKSNGDQKSDLSVDIATNSMPRSSNIYKIKSDSKCVSCSNSLINDKCENGDYNLSKSSKSVAYVQTIQEKSVISSETVNMDSSCDQNNFSCHPSTTSVQQKMSADHLKQSSKIIMTNQGFQQFSSDSENNEDDDDTSSLVSITFDDNFLEDIPEENDNSDNYIVNNIRDINSNLTSSNKIITTNSLMMQKVQQPIEPTTSKQVPNTCNELINSTGSSVQRSPNDAVTFQSSKDNIHHLQQGQFCITGNHQPFSCSQTHSPNVTSCPSDKIKCLYRSKSDSDLCNKETATSPYDGFFGLVWDSGKVLERSVSVSEIDLILQRSKSFDEWEDQSRKLKTLNSEILHCEENSCGSTKKHRIFIPPLPPSTCFVPHQNYYHQIQPSQHQLHQPHQFLNHHHNNPWSQTLHLDLSDVTELDEDGSELATIHDSLDSSHLDMMANDESPWCDVDEQKRFNSQFYSLCKVDSSRSLLSSFNESKDRLSLTSLNEILNNKSSDNTCEARGDELKTKTENCEEENVIAIREFDEISRQIASLSKTVDQLNQSLSSLNSGEFETSSHRHIASSSPFKPNEDKRRSGILDDYIWAEDEFFLTACNGEIICGSSDLICDDSFVEIFPHSSSFDLNITEDAASEFYQVPLCDHSNPLTHRNSAGQDEIFAGSFFATVKEKPVQKRQKQVLPRSGSEGNLKEESSVPDAEKRFSVPIFHKSIRNAEKDKNHDRKNVEEEESIRVLRDGQVEDQIERLTGSNNDSDDSLASDIGLDHMMCQRLFGRKGRFQPSNNQTRPFIDFKQFFMRYGDCEKEAISAFDFLENLSVSQSSDFKQETDRGSCSLVWSKNFAGEAKNYNEESQQCDVASSQSSSAYHGKCLKEMKDVGIDAMSQSQQSMNASFETFDQSLPCSDTIESSYKLPNQPPTRCGSYSLSEASLNQSFENLDSIDKESEKRFRNTCDLLFISTAEIVSHGECDTSESKPRPHSLNGLRNINNMANVETYSDFVADLKHTAVDNETPPRLPPRRPVISNWSIDKDIAPLPPPPPCLDNERFHPFYNNNQPKQSQCYTSVQPPHVPYVNQVVPVLGYQKSRNCSSSRPLSDPFALVQPVFVPPPIPPRQPHINRTKDGRPHVLIRPHSIHQDTSNSDVRPHSFNHYLINKPKTALSPPSSPASLSTYPRSRSHSETSALSKRSSLDKPRDETSASRIPRRKLKTRRERSQLKQNMDKPPLDSVKHPNANGILSHRQWRDINVINGTPMSDSSCEDNSS